MRFTKREQKRPFRLKFGVPLASFSVLCMGALLGVWLFQAEHAWEIFRLAFSFVLLGVPVYLLLTYFYNPDVLTNTLNKFTWVNVVLENILIPKYVRKEVLAIFPESQGKHALEFGSGVGTLTVKLAEHVGKSGFVYAVELSEQNANMTNKRLMKRGHSHVKSIHDPHMINRVHPDVKNVDMIVSIGNLSYIQDMKKVLKEMHSILPDNGQICFVEYSDFFWFLPNNPEWLSRPEEIKQIFSDSGFAVHVKMRKGLFWKYVFIYGMKSKADVPYI